jgi:metal-responsive CopG/Arc/MetJ family transcriptional regulator
MNPRTPGPKPKAKAAEIITFKADEALLDALRGVHNRSEFIRSAILAALDSACPLCKGTGVLTPNQKEHWELFSREHRLEECGTCHEMHLICAAHTHCQEIHHEA